MRNRLVWVLTAGSFLSFFVFGFVDNLKGPTLPVLLRDLDFSYTQGGTILFSSYLGFLLATLSTGLLADRAGKKIVMMIAGVALCIGLVLFTTTSAFWLLAMAMFIIGIGMGSIEVGGNTLIVDLHGEQKGRYLNLLALFHGIGATLVPLYVGQLLANGFTWRQVNQFSLGLTGLLLLYFIVTPASISDSTEEEGLNLSVLRQTGFSGQMRWYYTLIAVYVASEIGVASWLVEFLRESKGFKIEQGSLYLSYFFAFIMVGRLVGSLFVERIGYLPMMLFASCAAIVCITLGIFGPSSFAICIPLTGLFFSIIFPTTTAAVSDLHRENVGTILGILFACGGIGGAVGPWLMGLGSDLLGIQLGFALVILYCAMTILALIILIRYDPAKSV